MSTVHYRIIDEEFELILEEKECKLLEKMTIILIMAKLPYEDMKKYIKSLTKHKFSGVS